MNITNHNILLSNILKNISVAYRCHLCNRTMRLRAQIYLSKCSKCSPLVFTQAKKRSCNWRMAASMTHWSTASQTAAMRHAVRRYVADGLPKFSDKSFCTGLTIYVPTSVQNFIEISPHLAMLWQKCIRLVVNFTGFSVIHVLQGSVATYVRCGGMST